MTEADRKPKRILSGVQPSGRLHLGNYFGAIREHIALQEQGECFYFIADWHALTTVRDAAQLADYTRDVALTYLACGLDPERTTFYRQSDVPEVLEITWLLETVTGMGLLERAHSYKDKIARGITPSVGLFTYPALMAADILGPQTDLVPVGQDQDQHVEMTRDMATLFNNVYGRDDTPVFKLPEAKIGKAARVPGTSFEKGTVLQIVTLLEPRHEDGSPVDVDDYVARFRAMVGEVLAKAGDDELKSTEALEDALSAAHDTAIPGVRVRERILRVALEMPGGEPVVTPRAGGLGVEFFVPMDRVVFLTRQGKRVAAKMSKSYGNTIPIFAEGKPLKKAVMGIETRLVELADPLDAGEDIVIQLYALLASDAELTAMRKRYAAGGFGFGNAKKALLEKLDTHFAPIRERRRELEQSPGIAEDVLRAGAARARAIAAETLDRARAACGLGRRLGN